MIDRFMLRACRKGINAKSLARVQRALARGADVNSQDVEYGYTCMHYACRGDTPSHRRLRRLLRAYGARMDIPSHSSTFTAMDLLGIYAGTF